MSTTGAVNPTLIVSVVGIVFGSPGIMFGPAEARLISAGLIFSPWTVLLCQIVFFSLVDRDRL